MFRRMNYADAIIYLKEHDIKKDDGTYYEFGEVSYIAIYRYEYTNWTIIT